MRVRSSRRRRFPRSPSAGSSLAHRVQPRNDPAAEVEWFSTVQWTGIVNYDIDHLGDVGLSAAETRDAIAGLKHVAFAAISTGGDGVHCGLLTDRKPVCDADRLAIWTQGQAYLVKAAAGIGLKIKTDEAAKDALRLRFLAHDPDLRCDLCAEPLHVEDAVEPVVEKPAEKAEPSGAGISSADGPVMPRSMANILLSRMSAATKGSWHNTRWKTMVSLWRGGWLSGDEHDLTVELREACKHAGADSTTKFDKMLADVRANPKSQMDRPGKYDEPEPPDEQEPTTPPEPKRGRGRPRKQDSSDTKEVPARTFKFASNRLRAIVESESRST